MATIIIPYCFEGNQYSVNYNDTGNYLEYSDAISAVCSPGVQIVQDNQVIFTKQFPGFTAVIRANPGLTNYYASLETVFDALPQISISEENIKDSTTPTSDDGSITVSASTNQGDLEFSIDDGDNWLSPTGVGLIGPSITFNNLAPGTYTITVRAERLSAPGQYTQTSQEFTVGVQSSISVTATKTDVTVNGGSDGTITVIVGNGSGAYSYTWSDDVIAGSFRDNLSPGTYTVSVFDNFTGATGQATVLITEPSLQPQINDYFHVPFMQSVHFTKNENIDNITVFQEMDNLLLKNQKFANYTGKCYQQKLLKTATITLQFQSSAPVKLEMYNAENEIEETFFPTKTVQLTSTIQEFVVLIRLPASGPGSDVIFSNLTEIPSGLDVGSSIEIFNNSDGYNGTYSIQSITERLDSNNVLRPVVRISKTYDLIGLSSTANVYGHVKIKDYDIYEQSIDLSLYTAGHYYFKADNGSLPAWYSEVFETKSTIRKMNYIEVTNFDNAFGIDYSQGITHRFWIPSLFHKRKPQLRNENLRDTANILTVLQAKASRRVELELFDIPPYLVEKMALAVAHDLVKVNGIEYVSEEGLQEPEYYDQYMLGDATVLLEQKRWLQDYNTDDKGGIDSEQGFVIANNGYIRR